MTQKHPIGAMRQSFLIEKSQRNRDADGNIQESWVEVVRIFGELKPISAADDIRASRNEPQLHYRLFIRKSVNIEAGMRARDEHKTYQILAVQPFSNKNATDILLVKEVIE